MLGAIAGDIIGSVYESRSIKTTRFPLFHPLCRFTDDTVLTTTFGYHLDTPLDAIRPKYAFEVSCQQSVPQAIRAFLESDDYEDAVRKAISLGGDNDTIACIAGAVAEAFYGGVPEAIR